MTAIARQFTRSATGRPWLPMAGAWLLVAAAGCSSATMYKAASLPDEFQAPRIDNPQTIDLSKLASVSVSNELIDRGDVLDLSMVTGYGKLDSLSTPLRVGDDGTANIPLVGKVELAGLELEGAEQAIAFAGVQRGVFRNPHVTVTMRRPRVNKVTVLGAVEQPGMYDLPRGSSALLTALTAAGGLSSEAGTNVEIRRPPRAGGPTGMPQAAPRERLAGFVQDPFQGPNVPAQNAAGQSVPAQTVSLRVDLVSAAKEGRGGYYLKDGDVVMVEKRDPKPIHVIGLVRKPGQYELPTNQDVRVLDSLALAGGLDVPWADKMLIIRQVDGKKEPVLIAVSILAAKRDGSANLRLAPGDVVSVEQTPATVVYDVIRKFNVGLGSSIPLF